MIPITLLLIRRPIRRVVLRRAPTAQAAQAFGVFGGVGNDTFNFGSNTGPPGPAGPPGPPGPPGPAGSSIFAVTNVTTATYTALPADQFLCVNVAAPVTITLPVSPVGTAFTVKDCDGDAFVNPITIVGTAANIDGVASALINTNFGSLTFVRNATGWSIT